MFVRDIVKIYLLLSLWMGMCWAQISTPSSTNSIASPTLLTTAADSSMLTANQPTYTAINIKAKSAFSLPAPHVADSLDYVISLEWKDSQIPVMVLAPESLVFAGFKIIGQNTQHQKLIRGDSIINETQFIYQLKAITQGSGKASAVKIRYLSPLSKNEESVYVQANLIDIGPEQIKFVDSWIFKLLLGIVFFTLAYFGFIALKKKMSERKKSTEPETEDFSALVLPIKSRIMVADSKSVIEEMEKVATTYLLNTLKLPKANSIKFDTLLSQYLSSHADENAETWKALQELFQHARFAGGVKQSHELMQSYRYLKKCLNLGDAE